MAIAKKVISRVVGGITGKGAKHVNPVYKNMDAPVKDTGRKYDWLENYKPMSEGEAGLVRKNIDRESYRQEAMKKGDAQRKKLADEAERKKYLEQQQKYKENKRIEQRKKIGEIEKMRRPSDA